VADSPALPGSNLWTHTISQRSIEEDDPRQRLQELANYESTFYSVHRRPYLRRNMRIWRATILRARPYLSRLHQAIQCFTDEDWKDSFSGLVLFQARLLNLFDVPSWLCVYSGNSVLPSHQEHTFPSRLFSEVCPIRDLGDSHWRTAFSRDRMVTSET